MRRLWYGLACFAIWAPAAALGQATRYAVIDLGTLGGGSVLDINAHGYVSGYIGGPVRPFYYDDSLHVLSDISGQGKAINAAGKIAIQNDQASLYDIVDETLQPLGALGGSTTGITDLADNGLATGLSRNAAGVFRPFIYDGTMREMTSEAVQIHANGINIHGHVTGSARTSGVNGHAYFFDGTTMHDLGSILGPSSGEAINDNDWIAGLSHYDDNNPGTRPVVWDGTTLHDIGNFGGQFGRAWDINNLNQVVGDADLPGLLGARAFFYTVGGGRVDLNTRIDPASGWILSHARGINDAGMITGMGMRNGVAHGYLLTPVPEPIAALALVEAMAMTVKLRRRW
jgi:probable HAF family extracellular repeat protein